MNSIFNFFVHNWRFSFLLSFIVIMMGVLGLYTLQRESFPSVILPQ